MNILRLISTNSLTGRVLHFGRALIEVLWLLIRRPSRHSVVIAKLILRIKPRYTMVTNDNLIALYDIAGTVNEMGLSGDIVQCGVWNGGSAALMALADTMSAKEGRARMVWLYDSFDGLPPPTEKDGAQEQKLFAEGLNKGSIPMVEGAFQRLNIPDHPYTTVKGWFDDTLVSPSVENIAILHIDADWYDSVRVVLDRLYDKVVAGGFIILDDYAYWEGCTKALHDFLDERHLSDIELTRTGRNGVHFRKPQEAVTAAAS